MDLAMSYIMEADIEINKISDVSLYDTIFVEGSDTVELENNKHRKESVSLLKKAINVIKGIYQKIKDAIINFIDWLTLNGEGKSNYEKFVKECKNNPEFANKKITVRDWKKMNELLDKAEKDMEKSVYAEVKSKKESQPSIIKHIMDKFNLNADKAAQIGRDITVELTIGEALEQAKKSRDAAIKLKRAVDIDSSILNSLEKEIGQEEAKKVKKQLKHLSSKSKLVRWMAGARKRKYDVASGSGKDILNKVSAVYKSIERAENRNDDLQNMEVTKHMRNFAKSTGKEAVKSRLDMSSQKRALKRERKNLRKENKRREKELNSMN